MRKLGVGICLLASFSFTNNTLAQVHKSAHPRSPVAADQNFFKNLGAAPAHMAASSNMSADANTATMQQPQRIVSVPTFVSSFKYHGQVFPYTMMGQAPQTRATTVIPTSYVPISFVFDEFIDQNGNNITIDATAINNEILRSPEFLPSAFSTGNTQFTDAVQRAEFFHIIHKDGDNDADDSWHTLFGQPRILTPVLVEVPVGSSEVFVLPDGTFFALIDINFLNSQLFTLLQTENVNIHELPILLTRNTVYGDFQAGQPLDCCIGGYHGAIETNQVQNNIFVQLFSFATSLDSNVADGIFGDPGIFADVNALSHEIAETTDDPFGNNITPNYQIPGAPPGVCQNVLEIGDVIENLTPEYTSITLHGFTYHPQTMGLLQWFEGLSPSNAIDKAYSYPDTTRLTSPFTPCPASN
jgi:chitinase